MNTTVMLMSLTKPFPTISTQYYFPSITQHRRLQSLTITPIKTTSSDTNNTASNDGEGAVPLPPVTPPEAVEIRFRRGSRKKLRKLKNQDGLSNSGLQPKKADPPKNWESMTIAEKAMELYVGEKGLLFWLNKFAYASIYIIIGAWILFRFVGPALNLYQLDAPPLSPTSILKGS